MLAVEQFVMMLALGVTSLGVGYTLGVQRAPVKKDNNRNIDEALDAEEEPGNDAETKGSVAVLDLKLIKPSFQQQCKMVFVVRTDLRMTSGKIAAHHATLACYKALMKQNPALLAHWENTGQAKIALKGNSDDELQELEAIATSLNICARSIHDAGHTQVAPNTRTVLGIGPAPVELMNQVTGHLKLL